MLPKAYVNVVLVISGVLYLFNAVMYWRDEERPYGTIGRAVIGLALLLVAFL